MSPALSDQERSNLPTECPQESDEVVEEVLEASFETDRAHHDEVGRTADATEHETPSPREQPAAPLDVATAGK